MGMIAFYYVLLVLWLPLLWPAFRQTGWARIWLLIVAGIGLAATLNEIRMYLWSAADIRLDIFLIAILLLVLYATAVAVLIGVGWRKEAAALALALLMIGGGMGWEWTLVGRESDRVREAFETGNALLFQAKFRDPETYDQHFGPFADAAHPTGHWVAQEQTHYTRLIVNGAGQVWLFYECGATECDDRSADAALRPSNGETASELAWEATLDPRAGVPFPVRIAPRASDRLAVTIRGRTITFGAAPPPIAPTPAVAPVEYLGSFAAFTCTRSGQHAKVRQLWLWREGPRLYAIAVFDPLVAGLHASYISPIVLGEGEPNGDQWRFNWRRRNQSWSATVSLRGSDAPTLTLQREDHPAEQLTLRRPAIVQDQVIHLAPLTGKPDWDHWFANVLAGHFSTADIPAC